MKKEWEDHIIDNLRYEPESGYLWWTKGGRKRCLTKPAGSDSGKGYIVIGIKLGCKKRRLLAHRLAWFLYHKKWPENQVDHINGIRFDNKITNLREASSFQNQCNAKSRGGTSVYKGVFFRKDRGNWRAHIQIDKKIKHLGTFKTEEDAARAYDKAAKELFGEFAKLNFPEGVE